LGRHRIRLPAPTVGRQGFELDLLKAEELGDLIENPGHLPVLHPVWRWANRLGQFTISVPPLVMKVRVSPIMPILWSKHKQ